MRDIVTVNAPNGIVIATISFSEVQATATLVLTVVSIVCTVAITIHKMRTGKKD